MKTFLIGNPEAIPHSFTIKVGDVDITAQVLGDLHMNASKLPNSEARMRCCEIGQQ